MIICVICNKEITTINNIESILRTENNINECICKQCSNKTTKQKIIYREYKPCKRCGKTNVEALPFLTYEEDEMCEWCRLALKAGIDDFKLFSEDKKQENTYDDELETDYWIENMEDWGAFSDEGIMPGCHSGFADANYEIEEMKRLDKRIKEIGLLIKAAREKMGLSTAELAKAVDIPEYIEEKIESGELYFLPSHKNNANMPTIVGAIPESRNVQLNEIPCDEAEAKKWWENCDEGQLREEVWKYLYVNCAS